jgi:demethylmenaquinone methyltransferase/2-methoxy-6-polyprenyl-1,4-benzoquinol methylase
VVAADLTEPMLRLSNLRHCICADAAALPFASTTFDAVFIGYGLRNFPRLSTAIEEVFRVLKPGGVLVSLDFFLPERSGLQRLYLAYLYSQGAFWGLILHGRSRVYTYIPDSLRSFMSAKSFSRLLEKMGFADVTARTFLMGGISVHWAWKRDRSGTT